MLILKDRLTTSQLSEMAAELYVDMVKAVADVRLGSLINIRPRQNNRSRNVEDDSIRLRIREIVNNFVCR